MSSISHSHSVTQVLQLFPQLLIKLSYIGSGKLPKLGYCPQAPIRIPPTLTSTPNCTKYTATICAAVYNGTLQNTIQRDFQHETFYYTAGWHFIPQVEAEQHLVTQFHNLVTVLRWRLRLNF